jgi:hypothetical protein
MASDYGLNFGFRRSDESMAIREGRQKTPASGNPLLQGTAVQLDGANPGYLKQCAASAKPIAGYTGLLVQEESHLTTIFDPLGHDSIDLGTCKKNQLSTIWAGNGTKVWFKNTPAYSRGDRSKAAVTMVDLTGVAIGDFLGWDGAKWVKDATTGWLVVTLVATNYCEAVVAFGKGA